MEKLKVALIHYAVQYKKTKQNKVNLLRLIRQACENGAQIILTPEMSVSGYSFKDRADIAECVEDEDGLFRTEISQLAEEFGSYICVGLALRRKNTDAFCNSIMVIGPDRFFYRYDKVTGEIRWCRPGETEQNYCFDTQWGKIGTLICSDTYYDLQPRIAALKEVDLLLVPANWPPTGLDPIELWRARALENGIAVAACNRTGKDVNMSCESAESCMISDSGEILFRKSSPTTEIFEYGLPLVNGRLNSSRRKKRLSSRKVEHYHSCYRNINAVQDLEAFLELPPAGELSINCMVIGTDSEKPFPLLLQEMEEQIVAKGDEQKFALWLGSIPRCDQEQLQMLTRLAGKHRVWLGLGEMLTQSDHILINSKGRVVSKPSQETSYHDSGFLQLDIGPARVAIAPIAALLHPENSVALSKEGCDLIVTFADTYKADAALMCAVRTINHICVALSTADGAGIWMRPEGHARWSETVQKSKGVCSFLLDTNLTRQKRFQDRVDFEVLLKK